MNFPQIAQYPISELALKLQWRLTEQHSEKHGTQLVGTCPISGKGERNAFKITTGINRFICFCPDCTTLPKKGGDIIELMRRFKGIDPKDVRKAAEEVQRLFNGAVKAADNDRPQQEVADSRKSDSFDPLAYLKTLDPEHDALKDLDVLPETLITFQAGYSSKGLNRGRLAIAWHDNSGTLRFFIGMALDGTVPRYVVPKGNELPYFFNAHRLEGDEPVRILPDVLAVLRETENGAENVICPLRPVDALSLCALATILKEKQLEVGF